MKSTFEPVTPCLSTNINLLFVKTNISLISLNDLIIVSPSIKIGANSLATDSEETSDEFPISAFKSPMRLY